MDHINHSRCDTSWIMLNILADQKARVEESLPQYNGVYRHDATLYYELIIVTFTDVLLDRYLEADDFHGYFS